jgi:hypothetical protein
MYTAEKMHTGINTFKDIGGDKNEDSSSYVLVWAIGQPRAEAKNGHHTYSSEYLRPKHHQPVHLTISHKQISTSSLELC